MKKRKDAAENYPVPSQSFRGAARAMRGLVKGLEAAFEKATPRTGLRIPPINPDEEDPVGAEVLARLGSGSEVIPTPDAQIGQFIDDLKLAILRCRTWPWVLGRDDWNLIVKMQVDKVIDVAAALNVDPTPFTDLVNSISLDLSTISDPDGHVFKRVHSFLLILEKRSQAAGAFDGYRTGSAYIPTSQDIAILRFLSTRETTTKSDGINAVGVGEKARKQRLRHLEENGLVSRPQGKNRGWAITSAGLKICAREAP